MLLSRPDGSALQPEELHCLCEIFKDDNDAALFFLNQIEQPELRKALVHALVVHGPFLPELAREICNVRPVQEIFGVFLLCHDDRHKAFFTGCLEQLDTNLLEELWAQGDDVDSALWEPLAKMVAKRWLVCRDLTELTAEERKLIEEHAIVELASHMSLRKALIGCVQYKAHDLRRLSEAVASYHISKDARLGLIRRASPLLLAQLLVPHDPPFEEWIVLEGKANEEGGAAALCLAEVLGGTELREWPAAAHAYRLFHWHDHGQESGLESDLKEEPILTVEELIQPIYRPFIEAVFPGWGDEWQTDEEKCRTAEAASRFVLLARTMDSSHVWRTRGLNKVLDKAREGLRCLTESERQHVFRYTHVGWASFSKSELLGMARSLPPERLSQELQDLVANTSVLGTAKLYYRFVKVAKEEAAGNPEGVTASFAQVSQKYCEAFLEKGNVGQLLLLWCLVHNEQWSRLPNLFDDRCHWKILDKLQTLCSDSDPESVKGLFREACRASADRSEFVYTVDYDVWLLEAAVLSFSLEQLRVLADGAQPDRDECIDRLCQALEAEEGQARECVLRFTHRASVIRFILDRSDPDSLAAGLTRLNRGGRLQSPSDHVYWPIENYELLAALLPETLLERTTSMLRGGRLLDHSQRLHWNRGVSCRLENQQARPYLFDLTS